MAISLLRPRFRRNRRGWASTRGSGSLTGTRDTALSGERGDPTTRFRVRRVERVHSSIGGRPILVHRVQGHPGGGSQGGNALLPAGGLAVERCSEGRRVQAADNVPYAPSPTRGDCRASGESSTPVPQRGHPSCTTVPHGSASGGKG